MGRVAVELTYDYLTALGRSRSSLSLHLIWLGALIPALTVGANIAGIKGVAAGHAVVVVVVLAPVLGILIHRAGVSVARTMRTMVPVLLGSALIGAATPVLLSFLHGVVPQLTIGVLVCLVVYAAVAAPMRHTAKALWNTTS